MNRFAVAFLVLTLAAGPALAQSRYDDGYNDPYATDTRYPDAGYDDQGPATDFARVLSVEPMVERGAPLQREQCWNEPVTYAQNPPPRRTSGGGAVIGAIIGGLIGNAVADDDRYYHRGRYGRGHYHRDNDEAVATVAGAVIGGAIGNGIERHNTQQVAYRTQEVRRCRVVADGPAEEVVTGYLVNYEYAGRQYQTTTDYHPGDQIRVRVQVTPDG